jgi:hypothetical protein
MKLQKTIMAASLLLAVGLTGAASAHTVSGGLGNSTTDAARTDVFTVQCLAGSSYFTVRVRDVKTTPEKATKVSIQASKAGAIPAVTPLSTDTIDTDLLWSASQKITGGTGVYTVNVNKTKVTGVKGAESYVAEIHCYDAQNQHNPEDQTDPTFIQNQ